MSVYRELYRAEQLPVFQNRMFHTPDKAINCAKGDVILVQDLETGLIFNQAFKPELMRYDDDYQNEQAVSSTFREHLKEISRIIQRHFHNKTLVEIGCGKGFFLKHLQSLGFAVTGFDPIYEGSNSNIIKKYFGPGIGLRADCIILRHVLEHVQNPFFFLVNLRNSNDGGGKIYIEVPCFNWICEHCAWFDIYYEHVNYFRLYDFDRMFGKIYESGHTFGGQYLYVVADLATVKMPTCNQSDYFDMPKNFLDTVNKYATRLKKQGTEQKAASAIWGGASKGVIFALFMERAGAKINIVIDINPAKQGKYLAATGLPVQSPAEAIDKLSHRADIFVTNSNYLHEIQQLTSYKFNYLLVEHEQI